MRYLIVITMLLGIGYSQCNESNWQEYYNSEGHNMEGCDLEGANLFGADLSDANLENSNLSDANLTYADLSGANLTGANLFGAHLDGADLTGANLTVSNLCNLSVSPSGDVCEESGGITDNNGDGYDDASYDAGVASVDITVDNQASYDEGYGVGYEEGVASVDITVDNQEFYDSGYADGVASVDSSAIYDSGFTDGVASVDITVDNQASYDEGYADGVASCDSSSAAVKDFNTPKAYSLVQAYPNPFNPTTTIEYEMPQNGNVNVSIYNINGELVEKLVDGYKNTGKYSIQWNPQNMSSGQYFYQISVDDFVQTKKMVLLK